MQTFFLLALFAVIHVIFWYGSNLQLIMENQKAALAWAIGLSVPASILVFYATKLGYAEFDSLWTVRLVGFGSSYLVFPIMTYFYLGESPFSTKTMLCIFLSFAIICIQLFWKNT